MEQDGVKVLNSDRNALIIIIIIIIIISHEQAVANGSRTLTTLSDRTRYSGTHVMQKDDNERYICKRTSLVGLVSQFF